MIVLSPAVACGGRAVEPEVADAGAWGDTGLVEELRIGVETGPTELMFGTINFLTVGLDGTIYVADDQPDVVRTYDAEGNYLGDVGRAGQGPGEYTRINGLEVLPDGRLLTWDVSNQRVSIFSASGEYQGSFRGESSVWSSRNLEVDRDGFVYVRSVDDITASEREWKAILIKYTIAGERVGKVELPEPDPMPERYFVLMGATGSLQPFNVQTYYAWSPMGYLVVGRSDRYDIELRAPAGPVHLTREVAPTPVGAEERANWEEYARHFERFSAERDPQNAVEYEPVPATKPFFHGLLAGRDGRIWVLRHVQADYREREPRKPGDDAPLLRWFEPPTYDVFEPDGAFLGTVELPRDTRPLMLDGDRIWAKQIDEDGVEYVVRLRVEQR
ncbi:MAG: 6-bladed beta-propeller [Acidobacteriota bacterium]